MFTSRAHSAPTSTFWTWALGWPLLKELGSQPFFTDVKNDMRIAKFVVTNDISIGSILSENLLVDSLNDAKGNTTQEKLQILLSKIIGCKLPNPETFNEEDVAVKLTSTITSVDIANDNKFIKFAEQVKTQEGK